MNFLKNLLGGGEPLRRSSSTTLSDGSRPPSRSSRQTPKPRLTINTNENRPRLRSPPIERCVPPTCERSPSGTCVQPNPYNIFLKSVDTRGLTVTQRKRAYAKWKKEYMAMVRGDPVAFRAVLCMGKPPVPGPVARFLKRHVIAYYKECDIEPKTIAFFDKLIPTSYKGRNLNACAVIGRELLSHCVPPNEAKLYTFKRVLGIGLHGYVFQCLYKGVHERAIKLMVIHDNGKRAYKIDVHEGKEIWSISKAELNKELKMHQRMVQLAKTSGQFLVLDILSDLCMFKPSRFNGTIGVYIMESLPETTEPLNKELDISLGTNGAVLPSILMKKAGEVPRVIAELHRLGVAHSDMHPGNVAFKPKNAKRPYVMDFGRMQLLSKLGKQQQLYRILEYAVPLEAYLRWYGEEYPEVAVALYNNYLRSVNLSKSDDDFVKQQNLGYIFEPLDAKLIRDRRGRIDKILADSYLFEFKGVKYTYFDATEAVI